MMKTMYWRYQVRADEYVMFFPMLTWDAETFEEWILPDPTIGGILPGMTDAEFKRIFGITEKDWENMGGF